MTNKIVMKNHIVEKINPHSKNEPPTYTVYENLDKDLKAQIQSFEFDNTKVVIGLPREEWNIVEWEEEEVKCQRGRNIHYYKKEEVEQHLQEDFEKALNKKFPAYMYFKKVFGVLSFYQEQIHNTTTYYSLNKIDLNKLLYFNLNNSEESHVDTTSVQHYNNITCYNLRVYENGLDLNVSGHGQSLNLYFNREGNFVNRDYNTNLSIYERKDIDPIELYKKACETILGTQGPFQYYKGKFFTENVCYIISKNEESFKSGITLNGFKSEYGRDTFRICEGRKYTTVKRPKKFEMKTTQDLLEFFISEIPKKMLHEFNIKIKENA